MTAPVVTHVVSGDIWAGAEVQVYQLCRGLIESGEATPTAVLFNGGTLHDKLQALGVPVTLADETRHSAAAMVRIAANHLRQHRAEIVHTHGFKENVIGTVAQTLARVPASLRTVHGNPEIKVSFRKPAKWGVNKLDQLLGRYAQNAAVAVSSQLEDTLGTIFPGKVTKIFNFVDVEALREEAPPKRRGSEGRLVLGLVGRLVPVKRVDLFIDTIARLNEQGVAAEGVIIGDGPLLQALKQQADKRGVSDKITFSGFINPVAPAMRNLDALLMTSDHEGLPMTLLEALALEVPIIAHNVGGIPEVLDRGRCGWLVDDHSAEGYCAGVLAAFETDGEAADRAAAGLAHVKRDFDIRANTGEYLKLYNALYAARGRLRGKPAG